MMIEPIQTRVDEFDSTRENREIVHRGHINAEKRETSTIIMSINASSFSYKNEEKIDQMIDFCKNNKVDIVMISETNCKWKTRTKDLMSSKMKTLGKETRYSCADSKAHKTTNSEWLQGGLMSVMTGKMSSLIQHQEVKTYDLGRWMALQVSNGKKTLITITMHRTPQGTNQGIQSTTSQHNQILGKVKSATHHRKEIFKDIVNYVKSFNKPVDVMIGGDCNQDIASTEVQQFFNELQMKDVHQTTNGIELK